MQRLVIKVGTSVLTGGTPRLDPQQMLAIVAQCARLYQADHEVILVSSGAVAAGRERLGFPTLDGTLPAKQMLSAVGQPRLMQHYSGLFDIFRIPVAQVLLTREDVSDRSRFLNARDTLQMLLEQRIVPIINENDTIATDEIRVGDNDNLSALVATMIEADLLILLTDQAGLYTADPRKDTAAQLIARVVAIDDATFALAGGSTTGLGTGGMVTKIQAAQFASRGGVPTVIASGREPDAASRLLAGEAIGTRFEAQVSRVESRKRWLMMEKTRGALHVDPGAARAVLEKNASLLPIGVVAVDGDFKRGAAVRVIDVDGKPIAQGLSSYDSDDARRLCRIKSDAIAAALGYSYGDAIVHRNSMVVLR